MASAPAAPPARPCTVLLIRHGANPKVGKGLTGWLPGVSLNEEGHRQAAALASFLSRAPISAIYSSPLERALETAGPLARAKNLEIFCNPDFGEVHFGDWQGKEFTEIELDPQWSRFNNFRSGTRAPNGESMLETQARMMRGLFALAESHGGETVAVFSHADAIKCAISHLLGIPLDFHRRLEILPASITTIDIFPDAPVVRSVNVPCGVLNIISSDRTHWKCLH
jgi:probable phosphoglycerate mutase